MGLRQVETKEVTVGDRKLYLKPYPAFKAINLVGELTSTLVPLISAVMPLITEDDGKENKKSLMDADATVAASAMMNASESVSGDKMEKLMKKLLIENKNVIFIDEDDKGNEYQCILDKDNADEMFCGEVQDMFILAFEVIRNNFSGFFKKIATQFGNPKLASAIKKREII